MEAKEVMVPEKLVEQIDQFVAQVDALKITTQENYEVAAACRKQNKGLMKEVDSAFKPINDKQYAAYKETRKQWMKYRNRLENRETILSRGMDEWAEILQRKAAEEERLRQAQLVEARGEPEEEVTRVLDSPVQRMAVAPELKTPGTYVVEIWDYEVTSKQAVPDEYKELNHTMIRKVVQAMKDKTNIPGIRAFKLTKTRQRA